MMEGLKECHGCVYRTRNVYTAHVESDLVPRAIRNNRGHDRNFRSCVILEECHLIHQSVRLEAIAKMRPSPDRQLHVNSAAALPSRFVRVTSLMSASNGIHIFYHIEQRNKKAKRKKY